MLQGASSIAACFDLQSSKARTAARELGERVKEVREALSIRQRQRYLLALMLRQASGAMVILAANDSALPEAVQRLHDRSTEAEGTTAWVILPESLQSKLRPILAKLQGSRLEELL